MEVCKKLDANKVHLIYGNHPSLKGIPHELIACSFHWYAVSICNYALLVGWLHHETNPNSKTAMEYRDSVLEGSRVIDWRDKVAGHFARADDYKRDSPAERMASTLFPFGFCNNAFYASPMKLTVT